MQIKIVVLYLRSNMEKSTTLNKYCLAFASHGLSLDRQLNVA